MGTASSTYIDCHGWEKKIKRVRGVEQTNKITFEQYVRLALSHAIFY